MPEKLVWFRQSILIDRSFDESVLTVTSPLKLTFASLLARVSTESQTGFPAEFAAASGFAATSNSSPTVLRYVIKVTESSLSSIQTSMVSPVLGSDKMCVQKGRSAATAIPRDLPNDMILVTMFFHAGM
ncbi:hypothetical protein VSDG_08377 [Cytospora chrysosperma]|uniref:Uncharacterized protein n=1 Tax=Cytospora chrysosperma TaxID=252740 RepID=A0A423VGH2_CYTCH|nr:hypothetical protein VSDG_08377 [Valsa sordida]